MTSASNQSYRVKLDSMNEREILTMPAGRELDALIAEKVMGLVLVEYDGALRIRSEHPIPKYSMEMGAAWEVVDHMLMRIRLGFIWSSSITWRN